MASARGRTVMLLLLQQPLVGRVNVVSAGAGVLLCYYFAGFLDHPEERFSVWSLR